MMYHNNNNNENSSSSFSMLFAMPKPYDHNEEPADMYSFASSSSVDCTLSLGTPSTRLSNHDNEKIRRSSCISNFCWDILHSKHSSSSSSGHYKSSRGNNGGGGGGETLLARRCANCDTTSTPLWRNGPKGPKSLCNACGIRFKKEERRASAAAATHAGGGGGGAGAGGGIDGQDMLNSTSWGGAAVHGQNHQQKVPYISSAYGNEFRFIEDDHDRDSSHFLSWRLNVTDRPAGIVHEFTR